MHLLLLIVIVPFAVLFTGLGFAALTLLVSLMLEFPLVLVIALGIGALLRHYLVNVDAKKAVPCEQI